LSDLVNLQIIYCYENKLTQIKLPSGEKLAELYLSHNSFHQDLSFLSGLVGLKELRLGNNYFEGSLEHVKDLSKLEILYINDTDLDSGLEYLSESVRGFYCSNTPLVNVYSLEPYKNNNGSYKLKK